MAFIAVFRTVIFTLVTLLSFAVLGVCAHIEYLAAGYTDVYLSFAPLGIAASSLTIISLSLFLILGNRPERVFTSKILFEIIWFFILWLVWVGTAGDTVADKAFNFPLGCTSFYPQVNQVCYEFTIVEAVSFVNFFCAFIYYDVIFMYAIISAIRGRSIWSASVKEAAGVVPSAVNRGPIVQPQFGLAPTTQYQTYGAHPSSVPPQPYNGYPQQVPVSVTPAPPYSAYGQQVAPQGPVPQQYGAYPPQAVLTGQPDQSQPYNYPAPVTPPQALVSQQYGTYTPPGVPMIQQGQNQYNQPAPVAPQQWAGYVSSPPAKDAPLPSQPNYGAHPVHGSQSQVLPPGAYQPVAPQLSAPLPSPYDHMGQAV